jgi:hypothetical protein
MSKEITATYTLDEICNAAIAKHNLRGYNHLGRLLDIAGSSISQWRTSRTWPADSTMVKLAILADYDPREALINLNIWKNAANPQVTEQYSMIGEALKRAGAIIIIASGVFVTSSDEINAKLPVVANENSTQLHQYSPRIYIMRQLRRRIAQLCRRSEPLLAKIARFFKPLQPVQV